MLYVGVEDIIRKTLTGAVLASTSPELQHFHSHGLALYAFTCARQIGIDVEYIRLDNAVGDYEQLVQHYFSADERNVLLLLPTVESRQTFCQCWTRKEVYIKAKGTSLSRCACCRGQ